MALVDGILRTSQSFRKAELNNAVYDLKFYKKNEKKAAIRKLNLCVVLALSLSCWCHWFFLMSMFHGLRSMYGLSKVVCQSWRFLFD